MMPCVDKFGRPQAGGVQVVRSCTIPGHSRATIHCKVDGGYISRLGVVENTHTKIQLARSLNRLTGRGCSVNLGAVYQPLPGGGKPTVRLYPGPLPFCSRRWRAVVENHDGGSSTAPVSRAEDCPTPSPILSWYAWWTQGWLCRQRRAPGYGRVATQA